MELKSIFDVYFGSVLQTKEEVYSFISEIVCQDNPIRKEEVIDQLYAREKVGSILIAEHVMLPHIESDQIKKSQILFIRLADPLPSWDDQTKNIQLFIVVILKKNESVSIKREMAVFIRSLADDEYVNRLLAIQDKESFIKELSK